MSAEDSTKHIIQSLLVNLAIAASKGVAAVFTGSGAMLAETLHSFADCGNQGLLLVGVKRSRKAPDKTHPLGYGREVYFWSFIVALMLFAGGGVFSIYEGIHKIHEPEPVENVWVGLGILIFSLLMEGGATLSNIKEINRRRGSKGFLQYLRDTKDSDLVVIFGENSAAVFGLVFAIGALGAASATGDGRFDGVGSLLIGIVLVLVAVFLAVEVKSLLVGESADPDIEHAAREAAKGTDGFDAVLNVITVQQGPGEVLVAIKVSVVPGMERDSICTAINDFEKKLRERCPQAKWIFVEPDLVRQAARAPAA
ncbi:MAG: cation diffusion facilitator family transporter [Myxococcota bacterium]